MSAKCPICAAPVVRDFKPFCSKRCADRDLNRWLSGVYVVPGVDGEAADQIPEDAFEDEGDDTADADASRKPN